MFLGHLMNTLTDRDNTSAATFDKMTHYIFASFLNIADNVSNDCELGPDAARCHWDPPLLAFSFNSYF